MAMAEQTPIKAAQARLANLDTMIPQMLFGDLVSDLQGPSTACWQTNKHARLGKHEKQ
jgi:hypothetical protein